MQQFCGVCPAFSLSPEWERVRVRGIFACPTKPWRSRVIANKVKQSIFLPAFVKKR